MSIKSLMLAGSAMALVHMSPAVTAQDMNADTDSSSEKFVMDEIIVMARKRSESLTSIPETIDAFTSDYIERAGITSLDDIGRQTPNIILNRRQDNEPNVVIRGVGSFGNTQGVGFYVDDVQNFTDQSASIEDVERIEILKGPQGTLYGGSNVGGAIKYVLKKPTGEFGVEGKAEYGAFDTRNFFGAINTPVIADKLSARVSGYYNHTDSYTSNSFLGNKPGMTNEWGIRLALAWEISENLTADFSYRHNEIENGGNIYVVAADGADYSRVVDFNNDVYNDRKVDGGILTLNYTTDFADLTSVTSYTKRTTALGWDLDYGSADGVFATNGDRDDTTVFTQELRLTSNGSGPFDWLVGGYYSSVDNRALTNNIDLFLGVDSGGPLFIKDFNNGDTDEKQYALFATTNYSFGAFKIGGGLRVARSEYKGAVVGVSDVDVNDTIILPKVTLSYDLTDNAMIYSNIALGSEPGKANVASGSLSPYEAEKATNYELGLKGTAVDRRLTYDIAAFYITYSKRQLENRFVDPDSGFIVEEITNIGRSVSYGLEGGISYMLTPELSFSASGGYLKSEWDDEDALYNLEPVDGLSVPNAPKFSGNAALDYRKPVGNDLVLGLRADVSHISLFYWDVPNVSSQPAQTIVNLRASIGDADDKWELAIRGENIFDEEYFTEYTPDVFGPGIGLGAPGKPASVMASFSFKF
ncbi:TonB-dependent receptor [Kordiimonas pumila]|uniref:TonB-dependent receptor n=1 Tax=Kordiimonas pumila TaxID=2161677 RepID=A0ABV7D7L6_9PROT|nr:TonB-dependent receptor [Kordiimonas pumila]